MFALEPQVFSTDMVPLSDRIEAWQKQGHDLLGDCTVRYLRHRPFRGSLDGRKTGALEFAMFSSSPVSFLQKPPETIDSRSAHCVVIAQVKGTQKYAQNGTEVVLEPGDSTLIDSGRPWSSCSSTDSARLYLRIPQSLINRLRIGSLPVAQVISGKTGMGATIFRLATSLYQEAAMLRPEQGTAALHAYIDMLATYYGWSSDVDMVQGPADLCSSIHNFIERNLADPNLTPIFIAKAMGISVRHLHRVFSTTGHAVGDWIRDRRLDRCQKDLADPRFRGRSITDIAFFWGFNDSAHFSHCFRDKFDMSARIFRSKTLAKALVAQIGDYSAQEKESDKQAGSVRVHCAKPRTRPQARAV